MKDVKKIISAFYEDCPFPDYDEIDDLATLINKAERGIFARRLNEQIPINSSVLDAGCGTGQLANFLGIKGRKVVGIDLSSNSLRLANDFKNKFGLSNVKFYQMDIFNPSIKNSFDVVISNGVLHHTSDPYFAFKTLSTLVKKNGYIIIGLYNKYGRIVNDLRGIFLCIFGEKALFLDPTVSKLKLTGKKRMAWYMDQYHNPHESRHSMDEVLGWFKKNGVEFINSFPKTSFINNEENDNIFKKCSEGNIIERILVQLGLILNKNSEGGFFIMIGRKHV